MVFWTLYLLFFLFPLLDLLNQVAKMELKISKKKSFDLEVLSTLESLLLDVHATLLPKPNDYEKRRHLVEVYQKILLDTFGTHMVLLTLLFLTAHLHIWLSLSDV